MPFVEHPDPPRTSWAKWISRAVTTLSSSLYDASDSLVFVQNDIMDSLTDTIPPYAGADEGGLSIVKHLGEDGVLNLEMKGAGGFSGGGRFEASDSFGDEMMASNSSSVASSSWTAAFESDTVGLIIDSDGNTEGTVSYTTKPWKCFTNGSSFFSFGATTGSELAMAMKMGPVTAKSTTSVDIATGEVNVQSCAASVKFALPEDVFCGHVLNPEFLSNCARNAFLGVSWYNSDVLRGSIAFQNYLRSNKFQYGIWGSAILYKGTSSASSTRREFDVASSTGSSSGRDDCVAVGGFKIIYPSEDIELCVAAERCSNGDIEPTFGVSKLFRKGTFPCKVSLGMTTDKDFGASVAISVVDVELILGAHRRSDALGGLFGGFPSLGLRVRF